MQNKQIHFRLSSAEYDKLKHNSSLYGTTPGRYAKWMAIKDKIKKPKYNHKDAIKININLIRLGVNINQIARALNIANKNNLLNDSQKQIINDCIIKVRKYAHDQNF